MGKIIFENIEFFAYHGVFKEEQKTGTYFLIDLMIETSFEKAYVSDSIADTINYQAIYGVLAEEMKISSQLIEHVMKRIADRLLKAFPITYLEIKITKKNPPVKGLDKVSVSEVFRGQ